MMDGGRQPGIQPRQVESGQRFSQTLSLCIYSKTILIKQEAVIFFLFFPPPLITFLRAPPVSGNMKFISRADSSAHAEL